MAVGIASIDPGKDSTTASLADSDLDAKPDNTTSGTCAPDSAFSNPSSSIAGAPETDTAEFFDINTGASNTDADDFDINAGASDTEANTFDMAAGNVDVGVAETLATCATY